jgi:hypothetical protein
MSTLRRTTGLVVVAATAWAQSVDTVRGDDYSDAVMALNPTHYYRLNETTIGTVTDTGSSPINGTHEGTGDMPPNPVPPVADVGPDYMGTGYVGAPGPDIVYKFDGTTVTEIPLPGFDANNRSLFANGGLAVNLGPARGPGGESRFAHTTMTLATWFKVTADPNAPAQVEQQFGVASQGGERLWTNNFDGQDLPGSSALDTSDVDDLGHLQIDLGGGANLVISLDNRFGGLGQELISNFQIPHRDNHPGPFGPAGEGSGFAVKDNSWHHLVVSRNGDDIFDTILVIDGEHIATDRYADSTDSWGITDPLDTRIGTRTTAPHHQTFNGWIDELAIWINRQLTLDEAIGLWRAATGQVAAVPGDYNANGTVDGADYVLWRKALGTSTTLPNDSTAGTTAEDYTVWRQNFGRTSGSGAAVSAVPEPASALLAFVAAVGLCALTRGFRGRTVTVGFSDR